MQYYDDLNIFELAGIIQRMMFDENMSFTININGEHFNTWKVNVDDGKISVIVNSDRIKISEITE